MSDLRVFSGILIPLPRRDRSRIKNASSAENPIFMKAETITPRNRDPSPKTIMRIKRKKNPRLKGM